MRLALHEQGGRFIGRLAEMRFLLAPHVASNAKEQTEFYRLWQEFVAEYEEEFDHLEEVDEPPPHSPIAPPSPKPWWRWLLWLPVIAALAYFFFDGALGDKPDPVTITFTAPAEYLLREGDTVRFQNTTSTGPKDSTGFRWRVMDSATDSVLITSDSFDLDWVVPYGSCRRIRVDLEGEHLFTGDNPAVKQSHTVVTCGAPPSLRNLAFPEGPLQRNDRFVFGVDPEEEVIYRWRFGTGETYRYGPRQAFSFTEEGDYNIELKAMRATDSVCCYKTYFRSVQIGTNLPLLTSIPLFEDQPRQFLRVAPWVWWLLLLPLLLAIAAWRSWWRDRHSVAETKMPDEAALQAAYPIHDAGPYDIPYRDQSTAISVPADFYRIADQLRIREAGLRKSFDGRATVEATVRNGGFPRWRERAIKRPAEYLLLVPHANERQQQHRLLTRLGQFLIEQEAAVKVYFHSGRFDRFWNDDQPEGIAPEQLAGRYPDFRLIILGNGHGLLDPFESRVPRLLPRWQAVFSRWRRRVILTTEPVADWSFQEKLLHRYFLLYPVDSRGIRLGVEALNAVEDYDTADFNRWEAELLPRHQETGCRYRHWNSVEEHRDYLADDPELFRWLGGLCVVSQPDWNLTIAIGRALGIEVTHDRLLRLSRIPWLADNAPDHSLRIQLLATLSDDDEKMARQAVLAELAAVKTEVNESFAQTDWMSNRAVQEFALDPVSPANKQRIRELRSIGWLTNDQLDELDQKIEKSTAAKGNAETRNAHLDEWLDRPADKPWVNWRFYLAVLLSIPACFLIFSAWHFNQRGLLLEEGRPLNAWESSENVDDLALELNNEAVATLSRLDTISNLADFKVAVPEWKLALALLDSAKKIRAPEPYAIADSNQLIGTFNLLRKGYNLSAMSTGSHYLGMDSLETILAFEDDYDYERLFTDSTRTAQLILHGTGVIFMSSWMNEYDGLFAHPEKVKSSGFLHGLEYDLTLEVFWRLDTVDGGNFFSSIAKEMPVNLKTLIRRYGRDTLNGESDEPVTVESSNNQLNDGDRIQEQRQRSSRNDTTQQRNNDLPATTDQLRTSQRQGDVVSSSDPDLVKELADWETLKNTGEIEALEGFLREYPRGNFFQEALDKLDSLNGLSYPQYPEIRLEILMVDGITDDPLDKVSVELSRYGRVISNKHNPEGNEFLFTVPNGAELILSSNRTGYISRKDTLSVDQAEVAKRQGSLTYTVPLFPIDIDEFFSVELYFDNDSPDPRSYSRTTNQDYFELFEAYYQRSERYIEEYTSDLPAEDAFLVKQQYDQFFEQQIKGGKENFMILLEQLEAYFADGGSKITLELRGFASPRAAAEYNNRLTSRRMSSVANSIRAYNGGSLMSYINSGKLSFEQRVVGETRPSAGNISDRLDLPKESVYSIMASLQRRVEIIVIEQ
ncbi:hypothetical protein CEQ90_08695 [Lewinellaceae bacterium SD302]|nr:hypothetical protein CEQ90_08695 [Lewinellaceae bacterium SD302]